VETPVKVACVQAEPVILDRDATVRKLERLTAEAAGEGASLVVFPEAFIPVYPSSAWAKALAGWDDGRAKKAFALMAEEAVTVGGDAERRIAQAAEDNGVWIVTGVTEVDPERPGTLYNTLLYHDPAGALALKHRKLVPTNHEKIYIASTADDGEKWQSTIVHIARESRAFVVAPSHFQRAASYQDDFPLRDELEGHDVIGRGGSAVLAPDGSYLAGPLYDEEGVLYAELDPDVLRAERQRFDPAGHYHRPDVLRLKVRAPR
jgi:nitrilase